MDSVPARTVFDVIIDFLATEPLPTAILEYQLPDELSIRAHDLLERHSQGQLSFDEEQEMYDFMRADEMLSLLKAKTHLKLIGTP